MPTCRSSRCRSSRSAIPLTRRGFLVIASGNLTHNLRDFMMVRGQGGHEPAYVRGFPDWIWQALQEDREADLLAYRSAAPDAVRAHPSDEHLLPFFVAIGAAGPHPQVSRVHAGIDDHVLAMDAFAFQAHSSPTSTGVPA
jgi:4,5-DOPA dioxygenase extradiol